MPFNKDENKVSTCIDTQHRILHWDDMHVMCTCRFHVCAVVQSLWHLLARFAFELGRYNMYPHLQAQRTLLVTDPKQNHTVTENMSMRKAACEDVNVDVDVLCDILHATDTMWHCCCSFCSSPLVSSPKNLVSLQPLNCLSSISASQ